VSRGEPAGDVLRRIDLLLQEFSAQPLERGSFEELCSLLREARRWGSLAGVYECRIDALEDSPDRVELLSELAQLLELELAAPAAALERYQEAHRLDERRLEPIAGMRRSFATLGDTRQALMMAEAEAELISDPRELARLWAETGVLWRQLGAPDMAEARFRAALELDEQSDAALAGLGELAVEQGDFGLATRWLERRIEGLEGGARASVLEQLAEWLPAEERARTRELLREVVQQFPERRSALERLLELEQEAEQWERVHELQQRVAHLLSTRSERVEWALSAARLHLDRSGSVERALEWAEFARRADDRDSRVHHLRAELFRRTAQPGELLDALEALEMLEGTVPERSLEIAQLHERSGRFDRAAAALRGLLVERPNEQGALAILDRCLRALGQNADRLKVLERRIQLCTVPIERTALETQLGELLELELRDPNSAEQAYRRALRTTPGHRPAIERLRALLCQQGRRDELRDLIQELTRTALEGTVRARLACDLAQLEQEAGAPLAAIRDAYLAALDADRGCRAALLGLRSLAQQGSDPALLLEACERELELQLQPARRREVLIELIDAAEQLGDLTRALQAGREWAALETRAAPYRRLVALARRSGDLAEESQALEALEALSSDASERAACLERLGDLCLELPDPEALQAARDWYCTALEVAPRPELRGKLLDLYRRTGSLPELARALRREIEASDGSPTSELQLEFGRVLLDLGDPSGAREALEDALRIDATNVAAADLLDHLLEQAELHAERCSLLRLRIEHASGPRERRERTHQLARLLLDEQSDASAAVAVLRDHVDPSQDSELERLYERALEVVRAPEPLLEWLSRRESFLDGEDRIALLLRLAHLHHRAGQIGLALGCLRRSERLLPTAQLDVVQRPLLALVHDLREPELVIELLGEFLEATSDAATEAALRLERARIWCEQLHQLNAARGELESIPANAPLEACELQQLRNLARRVGAAQCELRALEALCSHPSATPGLMLELADLYIDGPRELRDLARAERLLRSLVQGNCEARIADAALPRLTLLLERAGRLPELARLLHEQLRNCPLSTPGREALVLKLGRICMEVGDLAGAVELLSAEMEHAGNTEASDELLCEALERMGDSRRLRALFANRARSTRGPRRAGWLRRWLELLEAAGEPSEARLSIVESLLELEPADLEIRSLWVSLLRGLGRVGTLAHALEELLAAPTPIPAGQRRTFVRELLRIYEGPLAEPARALDLIKRERERDASLSRRGARLAAKLDDLDSEMQLLEALVSSSDGGLPEPRDVRRLALVYCALGRDLEAVPLLWRALAHDRRDRRVLGELEQRVRRDPDPRRLLELLEVHFPLEPAEAQRPIAREGFGLAEEVCDRAAALRWIRRWERLETLASQTLARWVALERSAGDRSGLLRALRAQRASPETPDEARAEAWVGEAELQLELGQPRLARQSYEQAIALADRPKVAWLRALDQLLEAQGERGARLEILAELVKHPHAPSEERATARKARIELLSQHPLDRVRAAQELATWIEQDRMCDASVRSERQLRLLDLYRLTHQSRAWIELAETLLPALPTEQAAALRIERARRLFEELGARDLALDAWKTVVEESPDDSRALRELARLTDQAGYEAERVHWLERCAESSVLDPREAWLEAARIHWVALGNAAAALRALEHSLTLQAGDPQTHALRAELCRALERPADEIESLRLLVSAEPESAQVVGRWIRLASLLVEDDSTWDDAAAAAEAAMTILETEGERASAQDVAESESACASRSESGSDSMSGSVRRLPPVHEILGHYATARRIFEKIGDWDAAVRMLEREAAACDGSRRAACLRHRAQLLWDELRRAEDTCVALDQLQRFDTPSPQDRERWSEALSELGRWPEALEQRRLALAALGTQAGAPAWLELAQLALEHGDDLDQARAACERAEASEPDSLQVLELRIELHHRTGASSAEVEDTIRLGERLPHPQDAAQQLSRAAEICARSLEDPGRAWLLYRSALRRDPAWLPALLGAGEIARARRQWSECERMFAAAAVRLREAELSELEIGAAASLLDTDDARPLLTRIANLAADAALAQNREGDACSYLEWALEGDATDSSALESLATLSLRLGAYERARRCLETHLETARLAPEEQLSQQLRLARACEGMGDWAAAASALEEVLERRPFDEVSRAHAVDLLERLDEHARALHQLECWLDQTTPELRPGLALRAARIEARAGLHDAARIRLEGILASQPDSGEVWIELAALSQCSGGGQDTLEVTARALPNVESPLDRAALMWVQAKALVQLDRIADAVAVSIAVLEADPTQIDAADLLARHLGHAPDFQNAVVQLERSLDAGSPPPAQAAALWEALGRAQAGPLENLRAAERSYRRALEANPLRSSAREALADVTAFDPDSHSESLVLHRDLLEGFPGRPASWRALERIADHWHRAAARASCASVLELLGHAAIKDRERHGALLVRTDAAENSTVAALTEYLLALEEAEILPVVRAAERGHPLPGALRTALARLAGSAWLLADERIGELIPDGSHPGPSLPEDLPRRIRRRIRRAERLLESEPDASSALCVWREELLAQAAACALNTGRIQLRDAAHAILRYWPATRDVDPQACRGLGEVLQICGPLRALVLRIAEQVIAALPIQTSGSDSIR